MPAPFPSIYDQEWQALVQSGKAREELNKLRVQVNVLTAELAQARQVIEALRGTTPRAVAPRPSRPQAREPVVSAVVAVPPPPAPVVRESEEPVRNLDEAAQRFSLLELD